MFLITLFLACNDVTMIADVEYVEPAFDIFETQAPQRGADIILVIDGSQSMEDNWDQVYDTLPTLVNGITQLDFPWRLSAISADPNRVSPQAWLTPGVSEPIWSTVELFQHVTNLDGEREQGLDSSFKFARDFSLEFNEENDVQWIFISDEEDHSAVTSTLWNTYFGGYRSEQGGQVFASSVVKTEGGCGDYVGTHYIEVSDVTLDLCAENYDSLLDPIRARPVTTLRTFWLEEIPQDDFLEVYVDSTLTDLWTYDGNDNTITVDAEIPSGAKVTVTYYVASIE